jgi:AGZA family xanthine/uracil permease-like MFS transporter
MKQWLEQTFSIQENNSSIKKELIAGLTTFLAMAYITVVNPSILSQTGMDFGAVFVATCLAAALGSIIMGVYANYPIALAPGMGQNAFFAFGICIGMGNSWQVALGAVFISGVLFIIISLLPIREWRINSIPKSLKLGMAAGIGLFLGIIALSGSQVVVANQATLVSFGDLAQPAPALMLLGFVIIAGLSARKVTGAVVIGILAISLIAWLSGSMEFKGLVSMPPSANALFELDIVGAFNISMLTVILTLLLIDVFDTAGTLVGVATRADMLDDEGKLPRLSKALLADSSATAAGALLGTSSTTSYVESAAGVEAGGRTGLSAVVTGCLFLLCLFISPLAQSIPSFATASALLFVACLMVRSFADLEWNDVTETAPAIVGAISMPLSYSIADGIGVGFICYASIKLISGRGRECPLAVYVIAAIFVGKFVFL